MEEFFKEIESSIIQSLVNNEIFIFFAKILFEVFGLEIKLM